MLARTSSSRTTCRTLTRSAPSNLPCCRPRPLFRRHRVAVRSADSRIAERPPATRSGAAFSHQDFDQNGKYRHIGKSDDACNTERTTRSAGCRSHSGTLAALAADPRSSCRPRPLQRGASVITSHTLQPSSHTYADGEGLHVSARQYQVSIHREVHGREHLDPHGSGRAGLLRRPPAGSPCTTWSPRSVTQPPHFYNDSTRTWPGSTSTLSEVTSTWQSTVLWPPCSTTRSSWHLDRLRSGVLAASREMTRIAQGSFLCTPRRPFHWHVNKHGVHTFTNEQLGLAERKEGTHHPVFLHLWATNLSGGNRAVLRSDAPQTRRIVTTTPLVLPTRPRPTARALISCEPPRPLPVFVLTPCAFRHTHSVSPHVLSVCLSALSGPRRLGFCHVRAVAT